MMKKTYIKNIAHGAWCTAMTLLAAGVMTSCSDDLEVADLISDNENYNVQLAVLVPEEVQSRDRNDVDEERSVNTLTLFFYNSSGVILQKENPTPSFSLSGDDYKSTLTITLNPQSKAIYQSGLQVFIVANANDLLGSVNANDNISKVKSIVKNITGGKVKDNYGFVMTCNDNNPSSGTQKNLTRLAAKLTVEDKNSTDKFTLEGFQVRNAASGAYIASELDNSLTYYATNKTTLSATSTDLVNGKMAVYAYPSEAKNAATVSTQSFLIISGKYNGVESYYKLCLKNTSNTNLDIARNTWYQVEILEVKSKGYTTLNAAVNGSPSDNVEYLIHDHTSTVYNMISDGVKELGVSTGINQTSGTTADFTVRLCGYEYADTQYPAIPVGNLPTTSQVTHRVGSDYYVTIADGSSWMKLSKVETDNSTVYGADQGGATQTSGKAYKYTITFDTSAALGGEMKGTIRVYWGGLTRDIPVKYKAEFNPTALVNSATLIIHNTDDNKVNQTAKYWDFLSGNAASFTGVSSASRKLYGNKEEDMGPNKNRREGFHFPIMYGKNSSNPWWYEYRLEMFTNSQFNDYKYFSVKVRDIDGNDIEGTGGIWGTDKLIITNNNAADEEEIITRGNVVRTKLSSGIGLVLRRCKGTTSGTEFTPTGGLDNDYDYGTAELVITLYQDANPGEDEGAEFSFNLYHTGFFHLYSGDDSGKVLGDNPMTSGNYYYYEVVPLKDQYWLDRNIGATASGMYLEGSTIGNVNSEWPFTDGARGGFYKAASYNSSAYGKASTNLYTEALCPPGYRFPKMQEWDNMRLSPNFHQTTTTDNGVSYFTSMYESENEEADIIYFPKAKYYNGGSKVGDDLSGYYWTGSDATGTEKEQLGLYLKSMYMNGASSTYVFGDVTSHGMSLRCVADRTTPKISLSSYSISFNVKGATNVYLYKVVDGVKQPLFNWPGKAVGDYKTMKDGSTINFSYTSSVDYDELYVMFSFVNKSGKILTIGSTGTVNSKPSEVKGWKVVQGATYSFTLTTSGDEVTNVSTSEVSVAKEP